MLRSRVEGFRELRFNRVRRETVNDYNRREPREVEADVDAWVELYFESAELMQRAFERPQLGELFDDHPNWMECDTPANIRVYHVDETVIHAAPQQLALEDALRHTGAARTFLDRPVAREALRRVLAWPALPERRHKTVGVSSVEILAFGLVSRAHMDVANEYLALNAAGQRASG